MSLPSWDYHRPHDLQEAISLHSGGPEARYLAGGTDLLTRVRFHDGEPLPRRLIDLKGVATLSDIREEPDGDLSIGACCSVATVAAHRLVRERYPMLGECCQALGSYPLRHRATIGGNLCNASPCADTAAALLALEAVLVACGPQGLREIPIQGFFLAPGKSLLESREILEAVRLPTTSAFGRGHYGRLARRRSLDISTVAVLVAELPRALPRYRIALLSVAPTPLRVTEAERLLEQDGLAAASQAAELAGQVCRPITDLRGTAEYRRAMVPVLVERGLAALAAHSRQVRS